MKLAIAAIAVTLALPVMALGSAAFTPEAAIETGKVTTPSETVLPTKARTRRGRSASERPLNTAADDNAPAANQLADRRKWRHRSSPSSDLYIRAGSR